MENKALLKISDIRKAFNGIHALNGVNFDVVAGNITALIGPNGAGKSTLFGILSGLLRADSGRVTHAGEDITGMPPERIVGRGICRSFQVPRSFQSLSVMENLLVNGQQQAGEAFYRCIFPFGKVGGQEAELLDRAYQVAKRLRLTAVLNNRAGDISGGQKKLLQLGRALMTNPALVLLDEPMAGVNPSLGNQIADLLEELRQDGTSFLIVEHDLGMVGRLCDPVIVMAEGKVLVSGSFAEVIEDPAVQAAYLGIRQ